MDVEMTKPKTYTKEADVKAEVKRILKEMGFFFWMPAANGYGAQGVADFLAIKDGVFFAIETKFGKGKATPNQLRFLLNIHQQGGRALLVNEESVDRLQDVLSDWLTHRAVSNALKDE